jgi:hypothetical protein
VPRSTGEVAAQLKAKTSVLGSPPDLPRPMSAAPEHDHPQQISAILSKRSRGVDCRLSSELNTCADAGLSRHCGAPGLCIETSKGRP